MKNIEFCRDKAAEIQRDIEMLSLNNIVIKRRGGTTTVNLDNEIQFQQKRVDILGWAENATEQQIIAKIDELTALLPIELQNPINYISPKLPADIYETYCCRELLYKVMS